MSVIVDLSLFQVGVGESLSAGVARAVKLIEESGLPHHFGPMGTAIEGDWNEVMDLVSRCRAALHTDADRMYMNIKVDSRKRREGGLAAKLESVREKLG